MNIKQKMSGECYASEEPVNKYYNRYNSTATQPSGKSLHSESKIKELGLQDIEKHLQIAESRCNVLNNQLDTMKQVFTTSDRCKSKSRKLSAISHHRKSSSEDRSSTPSIIDETPSTANPRLNRQSSNIIGTENTGAAVRTINNILNGITDSVNRLSELHVKVAETPRTRRTTNKQNLESDIGKEMVTRSSVAISVDVSLNKSRPTRESSTILNGNKAVSITTIKRGGKIEKGSKSTSSKSAINDRRVAVKRRHFKKYTRTNSNNLVELYHNEALKQQSDSDDANPTKKSRKPELKNIQNIPPLPLNSVMSRARTVEESGQTNFFINRTTSRPQSVSTNNGRIPNQCLYQPSEAPQLDLVTCCSRNYELPTVSSKMKQVAKGYLHRINFKVIPFCPATSTTPSHNIGINIQQVMNIIKNRQPINGISLTLAHNIGLAAEKLNNKPFTDIVSKLGSKFGSSRLSKCPLSKTYLNYNQLQELAKGIPEETIEEGDEDIAAESPQLKTVYITGPSGDVEVKTRNVPTWRADETNTEHCTCVVPPNVDIENVSKKYYRNCRTFTANSIASQILNHKERMAKSRAPKTKPELLKRFAHQQFPKPLGEQFVTDQTVPLQGNEKNLKHVLTNLHKEFEDINKKYEELSQKASTEDENKETLNELEQLENELNKKEEEITMVMTLYKEVLALKQQVKTLKDKKSQASVAIKDQQDTKQKYKDYNNPEAAFHLTKLLRQIQHYQMRYKTNLCEE